MFFAPLVIFALIALSGGSSTHYDCHDLKSIPADGIPEQREWFDYCASDPMQDFTRNKYGEHRDWKTGEWTTK